MDHTRQTTGIERECLMSLLEAYTIWLMKPKVYVWPFEASW